MGDKNRKNVIVVGAGASKEFGLPVGSTLKTQIADLLDINYDTFGRKLIRGSSEIAHAFTLLPDSNNRTLQEAAWKIRDNMPIAPSIDNYMHTHSKNNELVQVGKLAITHAIIEAEKSSRLYVYGNTSGIPIFDASKANKTWLGEFFKILVAETNFEQFLVSLENITFISFNYDRCIHQFFYYASLQYFDVPADEGERIIDALNIIYPYGSVGDFTFRAERGHCHTNFGASLGAKQLIEQSQYLKTFTESVEDDTQSEIHDALVQADIVMFLGFGFLGLNMKLIHNGGKFDVGDVLGTVFEQSDNNIQSIRTEISYHFEYRHGPIPGDAYVNLIDGTCADFMNEFNRLLMG